MIEFFKQRKIVIIIGILVIIFIGYKIYNSLDFTEVNQEEILVSNSKDDKTKNENEEEEAIAVHVIGEVKKPGVVKITEGSRIKDVIEAAGGLTEKADISNVNLAYVVEDGMKIRIPSEEDDISDESYISEDSGKGIILSDESGDNSNSNSIVNINTASQTELEELPGIGPSISNRIVEYREQNGKFKNIEDIKNVTGIGDSKFAKIKDLIKVK